MNDPVAAGAITEFEQYQINKLVTDESLTPSRFDRGIQPIDGSHAIGFVIKGRDNNFWQVASYDPRSQQSIPYQPIWGKVTHPLTLDWAHSLSQRLTSTIDHDDLVEFKRLIDDPSENISNITKLYDMSGMPKARWKTMSKEWRFEVVLGGELFIYFLKNFSGTLPTIVEFYYTRDEGFSKLIGEVDVHFGGSYMFGRNLETALLVIEYVL